MKKYYVHTKAQDNGDHEVHDQSCSFLPVAENRQYLGEFASCAPAVTKAKETYTQSNGCYFCSRPCHTS